MSPVKIEPFYLTKQTLRSHTRVYARIDVIHPHPLMHRTQYKCTKYDIEGGRERMRNSIKNTQF